MLPKYTVCAQGVTIGAAATVYPIHLNPTRKTYIRQIKVTFKGVTASSGQPRIAIHRGAFNISGGSVVATKLPINTDLNETSSTAVVTTLPTPGNTPDSTTLLDTGRYQAGVNAVFITPIVIQADEELIIQGVGDGTEVNCDIMIDYVEAV